jgi:transketolase
VRTAFIETLCELAGADPRIWLLTGDLGYSVLERYATQFPDRYVNVGVAEQNLAGNAAGLALSGKVPFIYSIANFPVTRCLEQIRNDICYHSANVKIVSVGGGVAYGPAGYTHHGVEDLAFMRALPHMTVVAPGDPVETRHATRAIAQHLGPCYLRLGKAKEAIVHGQPVDFQLGRALVVRAGRDVTLISTGGMLATAVAVAGQLGRVGISAGVVSLHTLRPFDAEAILRVATETRAVFTIEEHRPTGGLGSAVAEVLAERMPVRVPFRKFTLPEEILPRVGSQAYLCEMAGLSADQITKSVRDFWVGIPEGALR